MSIVQTELVFSAVINTQTTAQQVSIKDAGTAPLTVSSIALAGANSGAFVISSAPTLPVVLKPGKIAKVFVAFAPGALVGPLSASLTVGSSDPVTPTSSLGLYGLSQLHRGGAGEPTLNDLLITVGNPVNVGGNVLILGTNPAPLGAEVTAPLFVKAGPGPVTITAIGSYSPNQATPFGWYSPGAGGPLRNQLGVIKLGQNQTLYPQLEAGSIASFDPGTVPFGWYAYNPLFSHYVYSQDTLNVATPHGLRPYPLYDRTGAAIANSYVLAFEDNTNGDYNDEVFRVTNVMPAH